MAISWECWNSAQSILMQARASPNRDFCHGFDDAGLAGASRSEEEQVADRTTGGVQSGEKHLVNFNDLFDCWILPYDATSQGTRQTLSPYHYGDLGSSCVFTPVFTGTPFVVAGFSGCAIASETMPQHPSFYGMNSPVIQGLTSSAKIWL